MSYCLNPVCKDSQNPDDADSCHSCGSLLRLQNRYLAVKPIGQGGFGRTFLAVDEVEPSNASCVIKQFFPKQQGTNNLEKASELFRQEALRLQELGNHPQIPKLLAYFEQDSYQYLVQEFIDGRNLAQELVTEGAYNEAQIRQLLNDLLPVLQFVHDHRVIHRDIKPANIVCRNADQKLFLVDLGAAKYTVGTALSKTGTVIGSAEYTAPEQTRGKAVFASDLYSLGATCIYLLTEMSPFDLFDGNENQWVWRAYLRHPVSNSLSCILDKMLQSAIKERYQSANEVLAALHSNTSEEFNAEYSKALPKKPLRVLIIALVSGVAGFVGIVALLQRSPDSSPTPTLSPLPVVASSPQPNPDGSVRTFVLASRPVSYIAISPDGQTLASSNFNGGLIELWNLATGERISTINSSANQTWYLTISPSGKTLASGSFGEIALWKLRTGELIGRLNSLGSFTSMAISPDEQTLVTNNYRISDGTRNGTVQIRRLATGKLIRVLQSELNAVYGVAISPDGQILASGGEGILADGSAIAATEVWNLRTGQYIHYLRSQLNLIRSVTFSPDGQTLVVSGASHSGGIELWNVQTGELTHTLDGSSGTVTSVAVSFNGDMLATGNTNGVVELWNINTDKLIRTLQGHSSSVLAVAISSDSKTLISGSEDGTIKLWLIK